MEIIKSNEEISELFKIGKRISNQYVSFIFVKLSSSDHGPCGRVAFIAGKKLGNAVWRNAAKRRMREIYRRVSSSVEDYRILFIAKSSLLSASYSKVLNACEMTLQGKLASESKLSCRKQSK